MSLRTRREWQKLCAVNVLKAARAKVEEMDRLLAAEGLSYRPQGGVRRVIHMMVEDIASRQKEMEAISIEEADPDEYDDKIVREI